MVGMVETVEMVEIVEKNRNGGNGENMHDKRPVGPHECFLGNIYMKSIIHFIDKHNTHLVNQHLSLQQQT